MYDSARANQVIEFISLLKHTGDFIGKPFDLLPWQIRELKEVYGTIKNGTRKYQTAYLEAPKKTGKTELIAAIALYHLYCDGPGGRIFCCAANRDQASLVYQAAVTMIDQNKTLSKYLVHRDSRKEIINLRTKSFIKVLSSEAPGKHGLNPSVVIFDELHAQPNRILWDTMTFGADSARQEPLLWVITTAGDDPDRKSIGWEQHEYALKVLNKEIIDESWHVTIYGAPDDADIYDEKVWHEANPSLGVTVSLKAVRKEAQRAKNSPPAERLFRWLRLNQWIAVKRIGWLPITLWDETLGTWKKQELLGERCYLGLDLSSKIDLTSANLLFPPQGEHEDWRFLSENWIPENNMPERISRDSVPYDQWVSKKHIIATPGDVVDFDCIKSKLIELAELYTIRFYCADPWHLEILRQLLPRDIAKKFIEVSQTMAGMSPAMGELERMFRGKQISHLNDPVGRWAFGNVVVAIDGNENTKPMKNRSKERIDPVCALVDAMAGAMKMEQKAYAYEDRGIRMV